MQLMKENSLETKTPREQAGRDSFARYKAQVRSAAIASLSILDGGEVDRIYCDLHDDFVIRRNIDGKFLYIFCQVKTHGKSNHNWTINEVFGINPKTKDQSNDKIKDSFGGKLILHTVSFGANCQAVVFQTNVNLNDSLASLIKDIKEETFSNNCVKLILERFSDCFSCDDNGEISPDSAKECLKKFKTETDVIYLKDGSNYFEPVVRDTIYKYSEVELSHDEVKEMLFKLLDLVERKSSGVIKELNSESIEMFAGISIIDLLEILSISKDAYTTLVNGGDPKALKSASIIQRTLLSGGASYSQVEYCSRCKIEWDSWVRKNRHIVPEMDIQTITSKIRKLLTETMVGGTIDFESLRGPIKQLSEDLSNDNLLHNLTDNELFGGVFSELVRGKS